MSVYELLSVLTNMSVHKKSLPIHVYCPHCEASMHIENVDDTMDKGVDINGRK